MCMDVTGQQTSRYSMRQSSEYLHLTNGDRSVTSAGRQALAKEYLQEKIDPIGQAGLINQHHVRLRLMPYKASDGLPHTVGPDPSWLLLKLA